MKIIWVTYNSNSNWRKAELKILNNYVYRHLNPLLPNVTKICSLIVKISFLKQEGIIEKISYERRSY